MRQKIRAWLKRKIPYLIILTLFLFWALFFFWPRIIITIHSGEAGVLYWLFLGGTETDHVYSEGFYVIAPWDKMYIYNVRVQTVLHDLEVLTNRGLPIQLKLAIRFQPEYETLGVLHQEVGPDYINTIIVPDIDSVLRKNLGHQNPEDIYVNKENILTKIIVNALNELGQKYVNMHSIVIRKVVLPEPIKQAIEEKLVEEQRYQTYDFKLKKEEKEAERRVIEATGIANKRRIEAAGIRDYQQIISETLDEKMLKWHGIDASLKLSESENAKVIVIGAGKNGLPIIGNIPFESNEPPPLPNK
ncbi:MAG: prohibitin family protein [Candidatus Parabeggiatoa sp. nov. 3]|nr:MAG: prohibitin family protein [Gammaproteobacteria bacterium]RKZ88015.1 MAG: prohibitin family protein [Gammaproteobacteria bacterium]